MTKKAVFISVLLWVVLFASACAPGDELPEDLYTRNIYPGVTNIYSLGSVAYQWQNGYFQNVFVNGVAVVPGPVIEVDPVFTAALPLGPASGGTGTANNAASTFTISGAFPLTATLSAGTNVTLPTTGTLATLAGSEELDNKTLDSSVLKGTFTNSGVWTIPAVTLGGTMSLNSQTFSGAADFDNTVTMANNTNFRMKDSAGTAQNIIRYSSGNQLFYFSPADTFYARDSTKNVVFFGGSGGSGRPFTWEGTAASASAGTTLRNSPGTIWRARYWNGAANIAWDVMMLHVMDATTPASTFKMQINSVDLLWLGNSNGTPSLSFFGVALSNRAAAYTQTYSIATRTHNNVTSSSVATTASTLGAYGYTQAQADSIPVAINATQADLLNLKQLVNSIIDDLQAYGLMQ